MEYSIEVKNLNQSFKDKIICDDVSINFEKDKIYGLLGKNGTGKTTLINMIAYQLIARSGEIKVFGKSPKEDISVLDNLCVVREKDIIKDFHTECKVKEVFRFYSYFFSNYDYELQDKLCKLFEINPKLKYKKLSRGMKTSVSNIIGICSNAPITIFDEPTIGLDAVNRQEFYNVLLESYMKKNRTVIIATHHIKDVEELLEKVVVIKDGKVEVDDYTEKVKEKSYYISGNKDDLSKFSILKDKYPLKSFGNTVMYYYYGDIPENDMRLIESLDIEIENMKLEELFVNINKKEVCLYE